MARKQTLTLAGVVRAARKAYKEGRLQAQANPSHSCTYQDFAGNPCAIGAALSPATIADILARNLNGRGIASLGTYHVVEIEPAEALALQELQGVHDRWSSNACDAKRWPGRGYTAVAIRLEREFKARLGLKA